MVDGRRSFVRSFGGAAGAFLLWQDAPPMPRPRVKTPVNPPEAAEKNDAPKADGISVRVDLTAREKQLRETMEELFGKVRDLKVELDAMHAADVFSLTVFKQTQEIEKLAKRLKSCARI